jgi:hypothetical protein
LRAERAEIGAQHEKFTLGKVDHFHHPENHGKAEANQNEDRKGKSDLEQIIGDLVHAIPLSATQRGCAMFWSSGKEGLVAARKP